MLGIEPDLVPVDGSVATYLVVSGLVASIGFFVIGVESQIIAAAILGGRALGRPMTLREALHRSRQVFWRVVGASLLVGFLLVVPNLVLNAVLGPRSTRRPRPRRSSPRRIGALLAAPFAYIVTGIVLGDVGAGRGGPQVHQAGPGAVAAGDRCVVGRGDHGVHPVVRDRGGRRHPDEVRRPCCTWASTRPGGTIALSLVVLTGVLADRFADVHADGVAGCPPDRGVRRHDRLRRGPRPIAPDRGCAVARALGQHSDGHRDRASARLAGLAGVLTHRLSAEAPGLSRLRARPRRSSSMPR